MIIVRTPLRVSFFGGGTDIPDWFREHGRGAVLSTAINKYIYIQLRHLPAVFNFHHRVVWREVEQVDDVNQIKHPVVRAILSHYGKGDPNGYEIIYNADLPARSGLGSSSAFTVACLHAFHANKGIYMSPAALAQDAIHVEQDILNEPVGCQDQVAVAVGGLNRIEFNPDRTFRVYPSAMIANRRAELQRSLMMFWTGFTRDADKIEAAKKQNFANKKVELRRMAEMVDEGSEILENPNRSLDEFGVLLDEAWRLKRGLAAAVSNSAIDAIYAKAMGAGALGGKLLGAGGGGFLLFYAPPDRHARIVAALDGMVHVPFEFENQGSRVVLFDQGLTSNYETTIIKQTPEGLDRVPPLKVIAS